MQVLLGNQLNFTEFFSLKLLRVCLIGWAFSGISKELKVQMSNFIICIKGYAMKNFSSQLSCALLVCSLFLLPGCWLKDKLGLTNRSLSSSAVAADDTTEVIATIDGKPLMTAGEFEKQFKNFIEKHPYGAMFAQMEGVDRKIFEGLVGQKIMTRWVEEQGINQTPEYKEYLDQLVQMLNARFFQMKHPVTVSDAEIKAFYDQNKESMPEAVLSRGGVNATGVQFAKEADAKAFLEKAKGKGATLDKVAKEANLGDKYRDFKLVNAASIGIDAGLRDKIVALKKFPALEVLKAGDGSFWVVYAPGKEEQKYRSYEELKPAIEQRLTAQKQEQAIEKAMEQLKKDYNVKIVEEYFTKKNAGNAEVENDEQLEMVMPEASENAQAKPVAPTTKAA